MATLQRWTKASNYVGEDYSSYFVVAGRCRDSCCLEESNFQAALKELGGESQTVVIAHSRHWAVGWVEELLVHESDAQRLEAVQGVLDRLEDYPVLDDEDYSERERQAVLANIKEALHTLEFRKEFTVPQDGLVERLWRYYWDAGEDLHEDFYPDEARLMAALRDLGVPVGG